MKKNFKILKNNKGITGTDICIAIIILAIFTGIISTIMYNSFSVGVSIQSNSNASAYATIILEKVDQKPFSEINNDFVKNLIRDGEIEVDSNFDMKMEVEELTYKYKKVNLTIKYTTNGKERSLIINKLKVNEIGA